ncbi:MAG: hypothetical protein HYY46_11745 [Deltaproteobacteria bacterium]|nr:hypothetical protein [Deltaproteobacteria bacterium]MBI2999098.1 hypothetical protein [Deltaproteobacteria bacterium]
MLKTVFMALLAALLSVSAWAQEPVAIHNGFVTGEQYLNMAELRQSAYAMGLVDGLFLGPFFEASKPKLSRFERCLEKMTDTQVAAILTLYLRDRPARWHESAHVAFYNALNDACPK